MIYKLMPRIMYKKSKQKTNLFILITSRFMNNCKNLFLANDVANQNYKMKSVARPKQLTAVKVLLPIMDRHETLKPKTRDIDLTSRDKMSLLLDVTETLKYTLYGWQ